MKKKNQNEHDFQKQPIKTGSENKEPENKKKPALKPMHDVEQEKNDNTNISEEIDSKSYSPELAQFLGECMRGMKDQLGQKAISQMTKESFVDYFEKLLADCDADKLVRELNLEEMFGLSKEEDSEEEQSVDDFDDVPLDDLEEDSYGNLILATVELNEDPDAVDSIKFIFPISSVEDDDGEMRSLVLHLIVPYEGMLKKDELSKSAKYQKMQPQPRFLTQDGETFYIISEDTYNAFIEVIEEYGPEGMENPTVEIESEEDLKKIISSSKSKNKKRKSTKSNIRDDGYYEDLCEYWYGGEIYHEKDVIWLDLPKISSGRVSNAFLANLDFYTGLYNPVDITAAKKIKVVNNRRVLSNEEKFEILYNGHNPEFFELLLPAEEVWQIASEYAKTKNTAGYCIVCKNGKFNVPVESFMNDNTFEIDELIVIFNAIACFEIHHKCSAFIIADIGNMQMRTAVRFLKGRVLDWNRRIEQELEAYRKWNPDYNPYDNPYDYPDNGFIDDDE